MKAKSQPIQIKEAQILEFIANNKKGLTYAKDCLMKTMNNLAYVTTFKKISFDKRGKTQSIIR